MIRVPLFYFHNIMAIGNKYKYALVDLSYVLSRNSYACKARNPEFTAGDVIQLTFQTLNKICRAYDITADKFIFLRDTWDSQYKGYYRTYLLKGLYKDSRSYMTEEKYREMCNTPGISQEELEAARKDLYFNQTKSKAKWEMIREFGKFGIPTVSVEAWECDDLAYLASALLMQDPDPKKSVVITKDSDIQYSITPKVDYFRIPTGGSDPQVITYDQMWNSIPESTRNLGISLYDYHAILESIGQGHNDMRACMIPGSNVTETIEKCYMGDFSNLEDYEIYLKHMESFDIAKFPRLEEAKNAVYTKFNTIGSIGTPKEFMDFCAKEEISGISERYYSSFVSRLDPNLYKSV